MSNTIDNRVVKMEFDNERFEENVADSLKTLDKLNEKLEFKDAGDGLADLEKKVNSVDFNPLLDSVQGIADKFEGVGQFVRVFMETLEQDVARWATSMLKSLTVDQFTTGIGKYEQLIEAEKTMTSSITEEEAALHGYTDVMSYVSDQMQKLMWFTDETSYDFSDMAGNIAKFTAQGVDLERSTSAMEGIALWAAYAGQNTQAASRAMYNLSQALGMGYVAVADWRSIELANMATMQFKEMVIETAAEMGDAVYYQGKYYGLTEEGFNDLIGAMNSGKITVEDFNDQLAESELTAQNFRNTLKNKWFTSEVLTEVLAEYGKYADAVSESLENLDGQIEVTEINGLVNGYLAAAEAAGLTAEEFRGTDAALAYFNSIIGDYDIPIENLRKEVEKLAASEYDMARAAWEAGNQSKTFKDSINYAKDAISSAIAKIGIAMFGEVDEAIEVWSAFSEELYEWVVAPFDNLAELFENLRKDGGIAAAANILSNIYSVIKDVVFAVRDAFNDVMGFSDKADLSARISGVLQYLSELSNKLKEHKKLIEIISKVSGYLFIIIKYVIGAIALVINKIATLIESLGKVKVPIDGVIGAFNDAKEKVANVGDSFSDFSVKLESAREKFKAFKDALFKFFSSPMLKISEIFSGFKEKFDQIFSENISKYPFFKEISDKLEKISEYFNKLKDYKFLEGIGQTFKDIGEYVKGIAETISSSFVTRITNLTNAIKNVKWEDIGNTIKGFFDGIAEGIKNFINMSGDILTDMSVNFVEVIDTLVNLVETVITDVILPVLRKLFDEFLENLPQIIGGVVKLCKEVVTAVINSLPEIWNAIMDALGISDKSWYKTGSEAAKNFIEGIKKRFSGEKVDSTGTGFGEDLGNSLTGFGEIIGKIGEKTKNFDIKKVFAWLIVLKDFVIDSILAINTVGFTNAVNNIVTGFKNLSEGLGDSMLSLSKTKIDKSVIIAIAATILALGGVVAAFAYLSKEGYDLQGATNILFEIVGAVVVLVAVSALLSKNFRSITSISTSLKNIKDGVVNANKSSTELHKVIIAFGISLALIAGAIYLITLAAKDENFDKAVGVLAMFAVLTFALIALLMAISSGINKQSSEVNPETKKSQSNMKNIANAFLGLGISILLIAIALKSVTDSAEKASFGVAAGVLAGMVIVLAIIAGLFNKNKIDTKPMVNFAESMILMGFGLKAIATSIALLSVIPWETIGNGALKAALILVGFTLLANALGNDAKVFSDGAKSILLLAAAIAAMSIALTLFIVPIILLSAVFAVFNDGTVWEAVGMLAAIVVVFAALAAGLGKLSSMSVSLAAGVGTIAALAVVLLLFSVAFTAILIPLTILALLFSNDDLAGKLWEAFGYMMAIIGAMALLAGILGIGPIAAAVAIGEAVLLGLAAVLLAFSISITASAAILAIGVALVVALITALGTIFTPGSEADVAFQNGMKFLTNFALAIQLVAPLIALAGLEFAIGAPGFILLGIAMISLGIGLLLLTPALLAFGAAGDIIKEGIPVMVKVINKLSLVTVEMGLLSPLILIGAAAMLVMAGAITVLAAAVALLAGSIGDIYAFKYAFSETTTATAEATNEAVTTVEETLTDAANPVGSAAQSVADAEKEGLTPDTEGIKADQENVISEMTGVLGGEDSISAMYNAGELNVESFTSGLDSGSIDVSNIASGLDADAISSILGGSGDFNSAGSQLISGDFTSGLSSGGTDVNSAMSGIDAGALSSLLGGEGDFANAGALLTGGAFTSGITGESGTVNGGVGEILSGMTSTANGGYSDLFGAGGNLMTGLDKGFSSGKLSLWETIKSVCSGALDRVKEFFGIKSPSKVMAEMGEYVSEGFAIGIKEKGNSVVKSAEKVSNSTLNAFSASAYAISNAIDGDYQPTIRPVLDLSSVEQGARSIGSMFTNPLLSSSLASRAYANQEIQNAKVDVANSDLLSAIDRFAGLFAEKSDNKEQPIQEFKFYLDGKELTARVTKLQKQVLSAKGG